MKKILGALAAEVVLAAGGTASAADHMGTTSWGGSFWSVKWPVSAESCGGHFITTARQPWAITVDGVDYSTSVFSTSAYGGILGFRRDAPNGTVSKLTVGGASYISCGADRLLLPGHTEPVPTLSEWAMILLGVLLAGGAALTIQRRKTA